MIDELPEDVMKAAGEFAKPFLSGCGLEVAHWSSLTAAFAKAIMADREKWGAHGFMDKVDFECELGGAMGGNKIYPDEEDCARCNPCIDQCGMVEVSVRLVRVVRPEDFSEAMSEKVAQAIDAALSQPKAEGEGK